MDMRLRIILISLGMILLIGGGVYGYRVWRDTQLPPAFTSSPGFILYDYQGNEVHLSDYTDRTIVAHSWASWCVYCATELQNLAALKAQYGESVVVIAVNRAEPALIAKDFTDKLDLTGVLLLLDPTDAFYKQNQGYAMPETLGLKSNGDIIFHQHGPLKAEELAKYLAPI
jgi:thiol-disulfide isomerase/thioredoxin